MGFKAEIWAWRWGGTEKEKEEKEKEEEKFGLFTESREKILQMGQLALNPLKHDVVLQ